MSGNKSQIGEGIEVDFSGVGLADNVTISKTDNKPDPNVEEATHVEVETEQKPKSKKSPGRPKKTVVESEQVDLDDLKQRSQDERITIDFLNADQSEEFLNKK